MGKIICTIITLIVLSSPNCETILTAVAVANDNGKQVVKTFYSAQATEQALSTKRTGVLIKRQKRAAARATRYH